MRRQILSGPHYPNADAGLRTLRRTRGGDAWAVNN